MHVNSIARRKISLEAVRSRIQTGRTAPPTSRERPLAASSLDSNLMPSNDIPAGYETSVLRHLPSTWSSGETGLVLQRMCESVAAVVACSDPASGSTTVVPADIEMGGPTIIML